MGSPSSDSSKSSSSQPQDNSNASSSSVIATGDSDDGVTSIPLTAVPRMAFDASKSTKTGNDKKKNSSDCKQGKDKSSRSAGGGGGFSVGGGPADEHRDAVDSQEDNEAQQSHTKEQNHARLRGLTAKQATRIERELDAYIRPLTACRGHTDDVVALLAPDICFCGSGPGLRMVGRASEAWGNEPGTWRPLFSASTDRNIRLWRLFASEHENSPGVQILHAESAPVMEGHKDWVLCLVTDKDSRYLFSGARDNTILCWNLSTGRCISTPWIGHTDNVTALVCLTSAEKIVSGSEDCTIRLWSAPIESATMSAAVEETSLVVSGPVKAAVSIQPDVVWFGLANGLLIEVDVANNNLQVQRTISCSSGYAINSLTSYRDRTIFAGSACGRIFSVSLKSAELSSAQAIVHPMSDGEFLHVGGCRGLAIGQSMSGGVPQSILYSTGGDGMMCWTLPQGTCVQRVRKHEGIVHAVCTIASSAPKIQTNISRRIPDAFWVATAGQDRTVRLWESLLNGSSQEARGVTVMRSHAHWVWSIAHDGAGRLFSGSHDHTVKVWDLNSHEVSQTITDHAAAVRFVAFFEDKIFTASADKTIKIFDANTYKCLRTLRGHSNWVNALVIDDLRRLIYSVSGDATIKSWSIDTGELLRTFEGHTECVNTVNLLHDLVLSGSNDMTVRIWHSKRGLCVVTLKGHTKRVRHVIADEVDGALFSASEDCTIKIWQRADNYGIAMKNSLARAEAESSGRRLESNDEADDIYFCVATLTGHTNLVRFVLKHGNILFSSSNDATIRCWDLSTQTCIKILDGGHTDLINSLVFIDGSRLLSGSHDNNIIQWDIGACGAPLIHLQCRFGILGASTARTMRKLGDENGFTLLMACAAGGQTANADLVLRHRPKMRLTDVDAFGQSALLLALRGRRWDFLKHFADEAAAENGATVLLPQKDRSIRELVLRRASRGDGDFFIKLLGSGYMLGRKLEERTIIAALLANAHELVMQVWGETRADLQDKKPLHRAGFLGQLLPTQLLSRSPKINVNDFDQNGNLALHLCLLDDLHEVPDDILRLRKRGVASDEYLRDVQNRLWLQRLACARSLLQPNERTNKPWVLTHDRHGFSPYDRALRMHDMAMRSMREPLHEIRDQEQIELNRLLFVSTVDTLDLLHDEKRFPEVTRKRHKFACQWFLWTAIPYALFLFLLTTTAFLTMGNRQNAFQTSDVIERQIAIRSFEEGAAFAEIDGRAWFWQWFDTVATETIWPGGVTKDLATFQTLVGSVEVRQLRMNSGQFAESVTAATENRSGHFLPILGTNSTEFLKWAEKTAIGLSFFSRSAVIFPASGYAWNVNASVVRSMSAALQESNWIDSHTRIVSISFTTFNENLNLLASNLFVVEFDAAGGAWPDFRIYIIDPEAPFSAVIIFFQVLVVAFFAYEFVWAELSEVYQSIIRSKSLKAGLKLYLLDMWNYLEWALIGLFVAVVVEHLLATRQDLRTINVEQSLPLFEFAEQYRWRDSLASLFLLLCYLRMVKYLAIPRYTGPTTQSIIDTLTGRSVLIFFVIILYILVAFAVVFHLAFAPDMGEFYLPTSSLLTLFRMLFGDFDYAAMDNAALIMGPLLFTFFMFFVPLLLLNLLIAVLTEAYTAVHERNTQQWERSITLLMIEKQKKTHGIRYTIIQWWKRIRPSRSRHDEEMLETQQNSEHSENVNSEENAGANVSWEERELSELIDTFSHARKLTIRDLIQRAEQQQAQLTTLEKRTIHIEQMLQELVLQGNNERA